MENAFPFKICELKVSVVFLHPDQRFLGRSIVVLKWHEEHLEELSIEDYLRFEEDKRRVGMALTKAFAPLRINYLCLGNEIPHLHYHVVPRYKEREKDPLKGQWLPVRDITLRLGRMMLVYLLENDVAPDELFGRKKKFYTYIIGRIKRFL